MRVKLVRTWLVLALVGYITIWYKIWWLFTSQHSIQTFTTSTAKTSIRTSENSQKLQRRIARRITIVIRQFEPFENDVAATVASVVNLFPTIPVIIICDELPYPPLDLNFANESLKNVKLMDLKPDFNKSFHERNPLAHIHTRFVMFLPDATRISTEQVIQEAMMHVSYVESVAIPVGNSQLSCLELNLRIKEWSLHTTKIPDGDVSCDAVIGKHVTIIESSALGKLSDPFALPFTDALYLQTSAIKMKARKLLFRSQQSQWKLQQLHQKREKIMFEKWGIKKVTRVSGAIEWYGCTRDTPRCFGSIVNGVPSYLYQNRFTPPCCLAGLRKVAHHVFDQLEQVGIRFWLEGSSLLGAMRNGDILPWDYQVEIGINRDDLNRSPWLVKARSRSSSSITTDNHGFVWEKATDGEFFKVQYSKFNRLHVNLLPFYVKNGTMTRDGAWSLKNHDFPEPFLHPMSSIEFAGRQVPSPNNIRDFLEIKYYKGVVENPELYLEKYSIK
ncbi:hypothetical protein PV326_004134 [Microctonus aethiopoides]|nr:hypothetical protein PV326_004134 [Microctonus aethiopoides]